MKRNLIIAGLLVLLAFSILAGCHNTGRQFRKMWDGVHDVLLEGTG